MTTAAEPKDATASSAITENQIVEPPAGSFALSALESADDVTGPPAVALGDDGAAAAAELLAAADWAARAAADSAAAWAAAASAAA